MGSFQRHAMMMRYRSPAAPFRARRFTLRSGSTSFDGPELAVRGSDALRGLMFAAPLGLLLWLFLVVGAIAIF